MKWKQAHDSIKRSEKSDSMINGMTQSLIKLSQSNNINANSDLNLPENNKNTDSISTENHVNMDSILPKLSNGSEHTLLEF